MPSVVLGPVPIDRWGPELERLTRRGAAQWTLDVPAHDVGPALSGAQLGKPPKGWALRPIRPGQVFAFDGFFAWKLATPGETKTLSVEEMAVVTETGAEYLIPPQEELILIPSPAQPRQPGSGG